MGERKAQENLKHDLVRRIKMLEYALKKERLDDNLLLNNISNLLGLNFDNSLKTMANKMVK